MINAFPNTMLRLFLAQQNANDSNSSIPTSRSSNSNDNYSTINNLDDLYPTDPIGHDYSNASVPIDIPGEAFANQPIHIDIPGSDPTLQRVTIAVNDNIEFDFDTLSPTARSQAAYSTSCLSADDDFTTHFERLGVYSPTNNSTGYYSPQLLQQQSNGVFSPLNIGSPSTSPLQNTFSLNIDLHSNTNSFVNSPQSPCSIGSSGVTFPMTDNEDITQLTGTHPYDFVFSTFPLINTAQGTPISPSPLYVSPMLSPTQSIQYLFPPVLCSQCASPSIVPVDIQPSPSFDFYFPLDEIDFSGITVPENTTDSNNFSADISLDMVQLNSPESEIPLDMIQLNNPELDILSDQLIVSPPPQSFMVIPQPSPQLDDQVENIPRTRRRRSNYIKKTHQCPHCQHTSNRANNMREHIMIHDPDRPKPHECEVCKKSFARRHDMRRHQLNCKNNQLKRNRSSSIY
ncbi:hypothetical protein BDB01DRAFT_833946 [Pilobolus umbonatus]|nr:hypothetical protein BDB01DRAFT_833946 [Pilobolus umbonatus]